VTALPVLDVAGGNIIVALVNTGTKAIKQINSKERPKK
jgi:hypothetical protein